MHIFLIFWVSIYKTGFHRQLEWIYEIVSEFRMSFLWMVYNVNSPENIICISLFDSKIAWLCQSIEINNNKLVYRQSQVRKLPGSGDEWAGCSLIIGTVYRVKVLNLIFDSSGGFSAGIHSAGYSVPDSLVSNPAFSRGRQLVFVRFENRLPVPEHQN